MLSFLLLLGCWLPHQAPPLLTTWNSAVTTAQLALARRSLPSDVQRELTEEAHYAAEEAEQRRTFLLYLQRQHQLPFPAGAVVVELPTSGEKSALHFFLLTKAGAHYRVTAYDGTHAWRTGNRTILPASFGDSLSSNRRCFYQGHNQESITVTRFSDEGRRATAQFFPRDTFCGALDTLYQM